jgi:hypothetical protein
MTTADAGVGDRVVESPEERRPARTIKLYILLGWSCETAFLIFGMIMFPQIHPPLIPRLIWTQIMCGLGMSSAAGGLGWMAASRFKQGSRAALIITGTVSAAVFVICANVCYFVDRLPGMDYWGTHENPTLFVLKGNIGGFLLGVTGSWLLNTKRGQRVLNKIPFLR